MSTFAAPRPWPPAFPEPGPATLYVALVYIDVLNKRQLPNDKLLEWYHRYVFPLHFRTVDFDLADPQNFDVAVTDIKTPWPRYIQFFVMNKTSIPGRVAPKNVQYECYVEYGSNKITVKKAHFVRDYTIDNHDVPAAPAAPAAPAQR